MTNLMNSLESKEMRKNLDTFEKFKTYVEDNEDLKIYLEDLCYDSLVEFLNEKAYKETLELLKDEGLTSDIIEFICSEDYVPSELPEELYEKIKHALIKNNGRKILSYLHSYEHTRFWTKKRNIRKDRTYNELSTPSITQVTDWIIEHLISDAYYNLMEQESTAEYIYGYSSRFNTFLEEFYNDLTAAA